MEQVTQETIIVAMAGRHDPDVLVRRLLADGHEVVGPATTAGMALALAAQTPLTMAVVHEELDGRRDGRRLAASLRRDWGLSSVVLIEGEPNDLLLLKTVASG